AVGRGRVPRAALRATGEVAPARRRAGAGVDAVRRYEQAAHFRLRGAEKDESLALRIDAIDQAVLVCPGIKKTVGSPAQRQDMFLLCRVKNARLAIRRERINTALGSRPSEDALAIAGDGETPDVRLGCLAKDVDLAAGVEAQHASAWSRAGVDRAGGGQCQAQDLGILAGVGNGHLPVGRNLEELALVSGGREKIAVLVLDDIPDVGCLNSRQGLELPRQAHSSLAADHRLLELGFVVMCWGVMMPDFDLGSLAGCGNAQDQCRSGGPGVAEHD